MSTDTYECPCCHATVSGNDHTHPQTEWLVKTIRLKHELEVQTNELVVLRKVLEFLKDSFALALQKPFKGDTP